MEAGRFIVSVYLTDEHKTIVVFDPLPSLFSRGGAEAIERTILALDDEFFDVTPFIEWELLAVRSVERNIIERFAYW